MMQYSAQCGLLGGKKECSSARRPFKDISTGYLDFMTESLWNGAFSSVLDKSTASSSGSNFGNDSVTSEPWRPQMSSELFGRGMSFFEDFGMGRLSITPRAKVNHSFGGFRQKKSASERKASYVKKCAYCKGPHQVKDINGVTICPELRTLKCPVCNNTNPDKSHTVRFCPNIRVKRAVELQQERDAAMKKSFPVLPKLSGH